MENRDKTWHDELHRRIAEAKQKAFDDEIKRIEKDVRLQAHSIVQKYFTEQETSLKDTLDRAADDRKLAVEKLEQRKADILRILASERKKKEEARRRAAEERKRQEELERKRREEEEEKRRKQEAKERKEKIYAAIETIRTHYTNGELEAAQAEIDRALEIDPSHEDLLVWDRRVKETHQKKIRDEEAALAREEERAKRRRQQQSKKIKIAAAVAVVAIIAFLLYQFQKDIFPQQVYLAIQPFSSPGQQADSAPIGVSIAREVAAKMSLFPKITVMDFSSSVTISNKQQNPSSAMNKLGYGYILSGTVTTTGGMYVADVKVVDSANTEVWSSHIEQPASTLMALPEEIAFQLAEAIDVDFSNGKAAMLKRSGTSNLNAYLLYLNGIEKLEARTQGEARQAYEYFHQAIAADSRFADAYIGAASVLLMNIEKRWNRADSNYTLSSQLLEQARKLQPNLQRVNIEKARLLASQKKFNDAIKLLDGVLQQMPRNSAALLARGSVSLQLGNYEDALTNLVKAYEVNPRDLDLLELLSAASAFKGKFSEAMKYNEFALSLAEDSTRYLGERVINIVMADADLQLVSGRRIIAACEELSREEPRNLAALYRYAQILQVMGKIPEANQPLFSMRSVLQNQLIYSPRNAGAMMDLALTLTRLGSFPEGLDMARRAIPLGRRDVSVLYKLAKMYSIQMASHKGGKIDAGKKSEALKYLKEAIALDYRVEELLDGDLYNIRTQPEFLTTIQLQSK